MHSTLCLFKLISKFLKSYFPSRDTTPELLGSEVFSKYQRTLLSLWVSFFEIYNESIFDLLDLPSASKSQKRRVLRICEDQGGNSYIKGNYPLSAI